MKQSIVLFLTAVLASGAVNGNLPESIQAVLQRYVGMKTEALETVQVAATASNSSVESILSELNLNRRKRQADGCRAAGPYGGRGGGAFHELPGDCQAIVKQIVLRTGSLVDAIQVTYRMPDGKDYKAPHHGGRGGRQTVVNINIDQGERIIGVFGKTGRLVDNIGFFTNKGRVFGPYGGKGGGEFSVHLCAVRGVFGKTGSLVDNIGFYCGKLSC